MTVTGTRSNSFTARTSRTNLKLVSAETHDWPCWSNRHALRGVEAVASWCREFPGVEQRGGKAHDLIEQLKAGLSKVPVKVVADDWPESMGAQARAALLEIEAVVAAGALRGDRASLELVDTLADLKPLLRELGDYLEDEDGEEA